MTLRFFTLALALLLFLFHMLALEFFWYWQFAWFDIAMHVLGGVLIASLFSLYVAPVFRPFLITTIAVILGIGWEVFESMIGAAALFSGGDIVDMTTDMVAMLAGVITGLGIVRTVFL